jgi:hypothetical protein
MINNGRNDILRDAKEYNQSQKVKTIINRIIIDTLRDIKKSIDTAHRKHLTNIEYKLQSAYNVEDMSNKTVQREVWSALILQLRAKHFKIKLQYKPNDSICNLLISWMTDVDYKKIKRQEQIIQEALA